MQRLKEKRVAVIGAELVGNGIGNGRAITMLFAREGARILAADWNTDAAQNTVARTEGEGGIAQVCTMDATYAEDVNSLMQQAQTLWGGLDILVHVVGISVPGGVIDTTPED